MAERMPLLLSKGDVPRIGPFSWALSFVSVFPSREDCSMKAAVYDIFRKDLLGTPVWMETAHDFETAELRMLEFARRSPAEYFVFSQETGEIVSDTTPKFAALVPRAAKSQSSVTGSTSRELLPPRCQLPKLHRILCALVIQLP